MLDSVYARGRRFSSSLFSVKSHFQPQDFCSTACTTDAYRYSVLQCKWSHEVCLTASAAADVYVTLRSLSSNVCVCVLHLREVKFDSNGVSGPIICNIRPTALNCVCACQPDSN